MRLFAIPHVRRLSFWIPLVAAFALVAACSDRSPDILGTASLHLASAEMPAAALPRTNETITVFVHHLPDGSIQGTWTATGAFTDHGTVEWTDFDIRGGPPIFSAGHVFAKAILSSDRGAFMMESREHYIAAPDLHNTWVAGRGVGFYERLEGQGTFTVTFETETAPGQVVSTGYVRF